MEEIRLNKYIAMCGVCSRRDADKIIDENRVVVDGEVATKGTKVNEKSVVYIDGNRISLKEEKIVLAYYKPVGVVCTERDEHAKRVVTDEINFGERVTYAGRLDRDSEGLLLLTNDGDLIDAMMRGSNKHEKEYIVRVKQSINEDFIKRMSEGIFLKELSIQTRPCKVTKIDDNTFNIVLTQGVNRQIRRMCASIGFEVSKLKRIRVMNIELNDLKKGEYRKVTDEELTKLYKDCNLVY